MIIICTHLLEEAEILGDEIFFLSKGEIVVTDTLPNLKKTYGLGYSIKVYKKNRESDIELNVVENFIKRVNLLMFKRQLKVQYFKTFLRVNISRDLKARAKHLLKTLELFFGTDFDFYLNSTSLDDVYFNISQLIRQITWKHFQETPRKKDSLHPSNSTVTLLSDSVSSKQTVLENELFCENVEASLASKIYILSANRLEFLVKNKIQLIYYFSSVVIHMVNFYFGSVFFRQSVFLYYVVSFFVIDIFLSSYSLHNLIYEKHYKIKTFLFRKGYTPLQYYAGKFFIDALLVTFQFVLFLTEVLIFFHDYRIKSRNLIFLLIGLYMWKLQYLASNYLYGLFNWTPSSVPRRLSIIYYLSFLLTYVLVFLFAEIFDILPSFFALFSETSYICILVYIKLNKEIYPTDKLILFNLLYQLVFIVIFLSLTVYLENRKLKFNYFNKPGESASSSLPPRSFNRESEFPGFRKSNISDTSDPEQALGSETQEEFKDRILKNLNDDEEYRLAVSKDYLIRVKGLRKTFAKKEVVNLTFGFEPGICLGLIGPNGSGKTTTINLLLSVIRKSGGSIEINTQKLETEFQESPAPARPFWEKECGVCFQEESLWNELTVEQHVEFMCKLFNLQDYSKVVSILQYFEIHHLLKREVYKLSNGERKKLLVVMNLVNPSRFYFFDETSANLDPDSREDLRRILNKLKIGYQATILTTTHFVKGRLTRGRDALRQDRHHQGRPHPNRLSREPAAPRGRRLRHQDLPQKGFRQKEEGFSEEKEVPVF